MALTLTKTPDVLSLTGNEIAFGIHSDNAFSALGQAFVGSLRGTEIEFWRVIAVENTIIFTWGTQSLSVSNFEGKTSNQYFYSGTNNKSVLEKLAVRLNSDYYFSRDFYCSVVYDSVNLYNKIAFLAREKGINYHLACDITSGFDVTTAGTDTVLRENFRIGWQVQLYDTINTRWDDVGEVQLESPDDDGDVTIDASEFLQRDISGHFSWPQIYDDNINPVSIIDRYRIKYFEYYGATPEFYNVSYSALSLCLQGEVSQLRMASIIQFGYTFYSLMVNSQRFLTFAPKSKLISTKQRELLYYYCAGNYSTIRLYVKAYFTDSTASANIMVAESIAASGTYNNFIFELFTGFSATGVGDIDSEKTVMKYEVWIADGSNNVISEYRTYLIDLRYSEFERNFIYRNKLGLYEVFRTTGMMYSKLQTEKGFIKVPLSGDYDITERSTKQASLDKAVTFTQNSGHIEDVSIINYISEFLESSNAYFCDNKFAYPIIIISSSYQLVQDKQGVYYFEFDYEFALDADSTEEFLIASNKGSFNSSFNDSLF